MPQLRLEALGDEEIQHDVQGWRRRAGGGRLPQTGDLPDDLRRFSASLRLEEKRRIDEDRLAGLRSEVGVLPQRAYANPEHHVESLRPRELRAAVGASYCVLRQKFV